MTTTPKPKVITIDLTPEVLPHVARANDEGHRRAGRYVRYCTNLLRRGETPTKAALLAALNEYARDVEAYEQAERDARLTLPRDIDDETYARWLAEARARHEALPTRPVLPAVLVRHLADVLAGRGRRGRKAAPLSLQQMAAIRDTYLAQRARVQQLAEAEDPALGLSPTQRARRDVTTRALTVTATTHRCSERTIRRVLADLGIPISVQDHRPKNP